MNETLRMIVSSIATGLLAILLARIVGLGAILATHYFPITSLVLGLLGLAFVLGRL